MKIPASYRELYKEAVKQGWTITVTGGGHLCWRSPSGRKVFSSKSPNGRHSDAHRAQLRRAGLKV